MAIFCTISMHKSVIFDTNASFLIENVEFLKVKIKNNVQNGRELILKSFLMDNFEKVQLLKFAS